MTDPVAEWWERTTNAALTGTARQPPSGEWPLPLRTREADPETVLLDGLALGSVWQQTSTALPAHTPPPAADDDEAPLAPRQATALLELALTHPPGGLVQRPGHLALWGQLCAETNHRIPPLLLPSILEAVGSDVTCRRVLAPVIGRRGEWLAAQSPAWSEWARPAEGSPTHDADDEWPENWQTWPIEVQTERLAALRVDDPQSAVEKLEQVWASSPAKARLRLLDALTPPHPDDEPFLESALDDRAATVRTRVHTLLDGLPTSRRAMRMAERLRALVCPRRRSRVEVELPGKDQDAAAVRDGLVAGKGPVRQRFLATIVRGAPLGAWAELVDADPARVLALVGAQRGLVEALTGAAAAQCDVAWAEALLGAGAVSRELVRVARPPVVARHADSIVNTTNPQRLMEVLDMFPVPWEAELSASIVARLRANSTRRTEETARIISGIADGRLHPDSMPALQAWVESLKPGVLSRELNRILSVSSFQQSIREAFS